MVMRLVEFCSLASLHLHACRYTPCDCIVLQVAAHVPACCCTGHVAWQRLPLPNGQQSHTVNAANAHLQLHVGVCTLPAGITTCVMLSHLLAATAHASLAVLLHAPAVYITLMGREGPVIVAARVCVHSWLLCIVEAAMHGCHMTGDPHATVVVRVRCSCVCSAISSAQQVRCLRVDPGLKLKNMKAVDIKNLTAVDIKIASGCM